MIEEKGTIVAVDEQFVWVNTLRESVCQSCSASHGCGQKALNSLSSGRSSQVRVARSLNVEVGDQVLIGIEEEALVRASFLAYLLPIITLILGAALAEKALQLSDPLVALAGLVSLLLGVLLVKTLSLRLSCNPAYHPQLLRKLN